MQILPEQSSGLHLIPRLRALLIDYDFEFSELQGGVVATMWGILLILPWDTFGSSPTFTAMQNIAPEAAWGAAIGAIGVAQLIGLIANWWQWRRRSSFLLCGVWAFVATMFMLANVRSTSTVVYPALSLSACWAYLRMRFI